MKLTNNNRTIKNIIVVIIKFIGVFIGLAIILIVVWYFVDYLHVNTFKPPAKLAKIPQGAQWKGGPDGGYWYHLLDKKDSIYRIEIFNDHDGESFSNIMLNNEKDFVMCSDCRDQADTISNILNHINFFSKNEIILDIIGKNNEYCYLRLLSREK